MCKGIVRFFVGLAIFISLPVLIVISVLFFRLLDPGYYAGVAQSSGLYEQMSQALLDQMDALFADALQDINNQGEDLPIDVEAIASRQIQSTLQELLSPQSLQQTVDTNINNIVSYLNGSQADIYFYLPKDSIRSEVERLATGLQQDVIDDLLALPDCTDSQLQDPAKAGVICIPSGARSEISATEIQQLVGNVDLNLQSFPAIVGDEQMTVEEFLVAFYPDPGERPDADDIYIPLQQARQTIATTQLVIALGWVAMLVMIIVFYALGNGSIFNRLRGTSILVALIGAVLAIPFALAQFFLIPWLISEVGATATSVELETSFNALVDNLLGSLVGGLLSSVLLVAVIMAVGGFISWIVLTVMASAVDDK